ncbi:TadE/TadG family type IV pilus assembly protein [Brucella sp. IR073]|uniref:TadE/TadG family type IV pilus assembly protein n=1 Tax=unclassified Brucella TaxID=2632610 RepID=UPI003B984DCF
MKMTERFSRFLRDRSGVAAVEFVLVAPLIILIYLGAVELSQGIEVSRNVNRTSGIVANLVAQQSVIRKNQLDDILEIGQATMYPYNRDTPSIRITAIQVEATPSSNASATVAWSYANGQLTRDAKDSQIAIPASFRVAGMFLVKVDVALSYVPITVWGLRNIASVNGGLPLGETYYFSPINSEIIICPDC